MKIRFILALAAVSLLAFQTRSFADTLFGGSPTITLVSTTSTASPGLPSTATDYDFSDYGSDPGVKIMTNFGNVLFPNSNVMEYNAAGIAGSGFFTTLLTPNTGVPFVSGTQADLSGLQPIGSPYVVGTFTALHEGSFFVTLLDNNSYGDNGPIQTNTQIGIGLGGGTALDGHTVLATDPTYTATNNDLTTFEVTNVNPGQVFDIYATPGAQASVANGGGIGGLIFNFTAGAPDSGGGGSGVPEPSSVVALLGLGAMGLFFAARSRMSKAA